MAIHRILGKVIIGCLMTIFLTNSMYGQSELIQHLDALAEGSIITDGSNLVTEWKDQTTFNNNATISIGTIYKIQDGSLSWLDFGTDRNVMQLFTSSGSDIWLDQSTGSDGFCVILSFKTNSLCDDWSDIIGNSSVVSAGFGLRYSNSGTIKAYLGGKDISTGANTIKAGDVVILAFNYKASTGQYQFWDSKNKNTVSGVIEKGDFSLVNAVTLGSTVNSSRYFKGYIGEIKIYDNALSDNDFQNERQNMFLKWTAKELDPPTPNPASFEVAPAVIGGTTINMTAAKGSDASGIIEYYFEEMTGNPGGDDSGWQSSPYYSDGRLQPHTMYSYRVRMRDGYYNTGESSAIFSAQTIESEPWQNDLDYGAYYGYQAWHRGPEDGWSHWFDGGIPDATHMSGDNWPDFSEYPVLYETQLHLPDGSPVLVYSCNDYETVDVHIRWMKEYGLKGCFLQRQEYDIHNPATLEQMDRKAMNVRRACEKYGIKFCLMPCNNDKSDSGGGQEYIDEIITDWKHCVDDLKITESPMYMHQKGKPVIGFWGLGFSNRQMTPEQVTQILDSFQKPSETKYKVYVMGGVPNDWRTNTKEGFMPVYERLDMISPWRPIFYDPYNQAWLNRMAGDKAFCDTRGIDYNPTVSPGASVAYQNFDPALRNKNPRDGGKYLWKQVYEVCKLKNKFMYVAMYDEIDEGTAMYKMAETQRGCPVLNPSLVPLNEDGYDLPDDWYLQIGTEIQKMLEGTTKLTSVIPINPPIAESVHDNISSRILKVYPIPSNSKLITAGAENGSRFIIFNILGMKIIEGELRDDAIDISSLPVGVYILKMNGISIRFLKV